MQLNNLNREQVVSILETQQYAIISPCLIQVADHNDERVKQFKDRLDRLQMDYITVIGRYNGVLEESFLILNCNFNTAYLLAEIYEQKAFIYANTKLMQFGGQSLIGLHFVDLESESKFSSKLEVWTGTNYTGAKVYDNYSCIQLEGCNRYLYFKFDFTE